MNTWAKSFSEFEKTVRGQMAAAVKLAQESDISVEEAIAPYLEILRDAYQRDMQLVDVMDRSDLVVKFNGPSVDSGSPAADIVGNALSGLHGHISGLARSIVGLAGFDNGEKLPNQLDPRLVGLARGSLIIGIKIPDAFEEQGPKQIPIPETIQPVIASVRSAIKKLSSVSRYVEDDKINSAIKTRLPDPAVRDALIVAASKIAPNGHRGINQVQMLGGSSKKLNPALTSHSRKILQQAVRSPIGPAKTGTFRGIVRAADLDAFRFEIRNVESYGSIRCVYRAELQSLIKNCFDHWTEVTGQYETSADGQPRLLVVETVRPIKRQHADNPLPFSSQ